MVYSIFLFLCYRGVIEFVKSVSGYQFRYYKMTRYGTWTLGGE